MNNSIIEFKKNFNLLKNKTLSSIKPNKCILCNSSITSCCNSHSVPRMILKNISENGKLLQFGACLEYTIFDFEKGVNNSGTFHLICNNCDKHYFDIYENESSLLSELTDKLMAQIALKNFLLQLSKISIDKGLNNSFTKSPFYNIFNKSQYTFFQNFKNQKDIVNKLNLKEIFIEIDLLKKIIESDSYSKSQFKVIYKCVLPYKVNIASQAAIAIEKDYDGNILNDLCNKSDNYRIQFCHICIFPLKENSLILFFYHKKDERYKLLKMQFQKLSYKSRLEYINWLIFRYTENVFLHPKCQYIIDNDPMLHILCSEIGDGVQNFGFGDNCSYIKVLPQDITNFLLPSEK